MTFLTTEELLYIALSEVKLHDQFFGSIGPEQDRRKKLAMQQYRDARREVMIKAPPPWATRRITLTQDASLPVGWYKMPTDFLAFVGPNPILDSGTDWIGGMLYQLSSNNIYYVYDHENELVDPLFQKAVRYAFLSKLVAAEDAASTYASIILAKEKEYFHEYATSINMQKASLNRSRHHVSMNFGNSYYSV